MFTNIADFKDFKEICRTENVQFHMYAIAIEKVLTVALKGLIKLPDKIIINSLKT